MRRTPFPAIALCAVLAASACGSPDTARDGDEGAPGGTGFEAAYPKGTQVGHETVASARFTEYLDRSGTGPYIVPWADPIVPIGVPDAVISEALSPHLISYNDMRGGAGAYCLEQGSVTADQFVRKQLPDDIFWPCAATYLSELGAAPDALPLFREKQITFASVGTAVGPLSLAVGMDWTTYGMNDSRPVFIVTPEGFMQPYFNFSWSAQLEAVIEAASTSIWKEMEDERARVEGIDLDIGFYGTTDTSVGELRSVGDTYELPTETALLSAHCCDYPYTIRFTYVFDATGAPLDIRFDGFCWAEDWVVGNPTGDPAIDNPPRYDLPGCAIRSL